MAYQKRAKNTGAKLMILGIVFVIVLSMSVQIVRLYRKNLDYIAKEQNLQQQLDEEAARSEELEQYEQYIQSQDYVESTAKSRLGLVYEDEIIFREAQ